MPSFVHPDLKDVSLAAALHALADPVRLAMVAQLAGGETLNCTATCPLQSIPKSTLSNHFKVLRGAGIVETRAEGREMLSTLRREAFEARFPGLLASILDNQRAGCVV
ncbi:helix-turn-helix domain-containing protein [Sphingomonas sp. AOB5]|uniref:ArsR/SmtB family transcription factor n=1 Tax=Sphingomonas sp. AOB5 TaxID=3034017 RepID=UPI0023F95265|nr:helix-turn-helix domain-containing protein [Sphingomonas sp. AOB5]MDF7777684.1 helix-turn-helix domain-containing protein [Sphingomonas sp. AOB5]